MKSKNEYLQLLRQYYFEIDEDVISNAVLESAPPLHGVIPKIKEDIVSKGFF